MSNTKSNTNTPGTAGTPGANPEAPHTGAARTSKSPSHAVYHVRETGARGGRGKSFWTRIGSAWAHQDGKGFNIQVECVPLDGRLTLRVPHEKDEK